VALTIAETAAALRIGPKTVYRLIAAGDVASCDVAPSGSRASKTRVPRTALEQFIERRTRRTHTLCSA
jgi:excisionase family DNA binding protein